MLTFLAVLVGCTSPPAPPPGPGVDVVLPVRWAPGPAPSGTVDFVLDAPAGAGSQLHLDGTWWRADLTLDGASLPSVTPGFAPLDVTLPPLAAGAHQLGIRVSPPGAEPPVVSLPNKTRAALGGTLTLRLQASAALGPVALPLVDGEVVPAVSVSGAPEGATVEVSVSLDGERLVGWGPAPVGSTLPPARWSGATWGIGAPALHVATATLRDAGGAVLAERSTRVGLRETTLVDGVFTLDGERTALVAVRGQPVDDPAVVAGLVAAAGLDAVELHGAIAGPAWFARFDEWGLPLVQVARCDGKLWAQGVNPRQVLSEQAAVLAEQDGRLLAASASRPAVLAWVCEGTDDLRGVACGGLRKDPLHRPVFGVDVPGVSISGTHAPAASGPTWVIELGHPHGGVLPAPSVAARTFLTGVGPKGSGGVIPTPEGAEGAAWGEAWGEAARSLGAPKWAPAKRRAPSVVTVTGMQPGHIAVLHAPWIAPTGAVADPTGSARIEVWYEGAATVLVGGKEHPVTLTADTWDGTRRVSAATPLAVGGG